MVIHATPPRQKSIKKAKYIARINPAEVMNRPFVNFSNPILWWSFEERVWKIAILDYGEVSFMCY